jgi:hypothetical protein
MSGKEAWMATYRCRHCGEFEAELDDVETEYGRPFSVLRRCPACGRLARAGAWTAHPSGCLRTMPAGWAGPCSFDQEKGTPRVWEP